MNGPLSKHYEGDTADQQLVRAARDGSSDALDALVRRHQGFIYSIALRMLWHPQDAEDATQEILIKIVTGLSSFRGESAFRTWAYRIATNHVLNSQRSRAEKVVIGFDEVRAVVAPGETPPSDVTAVDYFYRQIGDWRSA